MVAIGNDSVVAQWRLGLLYGPFDRGEEES
jgi:hypothetical protein